MAGSKELTMNAVGFVLNRSARKQKMELLVDPSERTFLSRATGDKDRIDIVLRRENMPPIEFSGVPVGMRLRLRDVALKDSNQIGLLEFLINDDEALPCQIEMAYTPEQDDLPFEPDEPADERTYIIDDAGFVTNPIEIQVVVPDFLKAECKLLFAHIDHDWQYGYEIKGRVQRSRRVNTLLREGWYDFGLCLHDLSTTIEEDLKDDRSRLGEFLVWKIDAAAKAVEDRNADLAEAMAEPVHLPADFLTGAKEDLATESTEATEVNEVNKVNEVSSSEVAEPEVLTFKAKGLKQAAVTITLQGRDDGWWRAGFVWQLGNATDGDRCEASDYYQGKPLCLQNLLANVAISLAAMQISGNADARRSMESRRNTLREQFEDWLQEKIDAEKEDPPRDQDGT